MKPLRTFEEFLELGIVMKRTPDLARAKSLVEEAGKRKEFLQDIFEKVGLSDKNANYFIENSYDMLIELIRARLLVQGYHSSGEGAHEAEVSFMRRMKFSESETRFMNDLRYFRNGILYYGKSFDAEYGRKVMDFLNKMYPKLKFKR